MEICTNQTLDKLLRSRINFAPSLQHHAHRQVLCEPAEEDEGEGEEGLGQVQGGGGGTGQAPGHHEVHLEEVRQHETHFNNFKEQSDLLLKINNGIDIFHLIPKGRTTCTVSEKCK